MMNTHTQRNTKKHKETNRFELGFFLTFQTSVLFDSANCGCGIPCIPERLLLPIRSGQEAPVGLYDVTE